MRIGTRASTIRARSHRLLAAIGCMLLALLPALGAAGHALAAGATYRTSQVVARLNPASGATIDAINATYGTSTLRQLAGSPGIYLLQTPGGKDAQLIAEAMATDLRLQFAEPNFIAQPPEADPIRIKGFGSADPAPYTGQYAASMLGLARAQAIDRGQRAIVAVIDTGVQPRHPALQAALVAGYDMLDGDAQPDDTTNGIDDDGDGLVDEAAGHGTHVAGIIHLVAPAARIMPLRAIDSDGTGDEFAIARAIDFAISHGANVINLSLGTPAESALFKDMARAATRAGAVVVAAAGNIGSSQKQYPAATSCVLAITAIGPADIKPDFANFGSWVDVAAPGVAIYSTIPQDAYAYWGGTSMATPFVAGQAALIHSLRPALNPREAAAVIVGSAQSLDAANPTYSGELGYGRVDIGASMALLAAGSPLAFGPTPLSGSCVAGDA